MGTLAYLASCIVVYLAFVKKLEWDGFVAGFALLWGPILTVTLLIDAWLRLPFNKKKLTEIKFKDGTKSYISNIRPAKDFN
jgi:hypothetical protein